MNKVQAAEDRLVVPTFGDCVLGYRVWRLAEDGELWPLAKRRVPWDVGINTARCNCQTSDRLHFAWSLVGGQRRLEPAALHDAPAELCRCGLYSLRRPQAKWADDHRLRSGQYVAGAVASWGRLQVHATGARAEHACVLALALVPGAEAATVERVERAARRYGVEAVAFADLETAAAPHAQPLPDAVHDMAAYPDEQSGTDEAVLVNDPTRAPTGPGAAPRGAHATEDELEDRVPLPGRGALGARHAVFALALVTVLVLLLVALDHHPSGCRIVQASDSPGQTVDCSHAPPAGR